jgi:hypothetical protein
MINGIVHIQAKVMNNLRKYKIDINKLMNN